MDSSREKCTFCYHDFDVPQDGCSDEDSTAAKFCNLCITAFKEGTYCLQFHKDDGDWEECCTCQKKLHCGCILALNTFDLAEGGSVICKECVKNRSDLASPDCLIHYGAQKESSSQRIYL